MKNLLLYSLFFLCFSSFKSGKKASNLDFNFAENYCRKINEEVQKTAYKYALNSDEIIPIIYPECSRFSSISNIFETSILEYFYVQNGCKTTSGADFSIGYFQMKPSFIENLEEIILNDTIFQKQKSKFTYKSKNVKEIRAARLDRLMNQAWKIEYLCCFVKFMKNRYLEEKIEIDQISFCSAAYNYGFQNSSKEIIEWTKVRAFPNGIKNQSENYIYSELAKDYQKNMRN